MIVRNTKHMLVGSIAFMAKMLFHCMTLLEIQKYFYFLNKSFHIYKKKQHQKTNNNNNNPTHDGVIMPFVPVGFIMHLL